MRVTVIRRKLIPALVLSLLAGACAAGIDAELPPAAAAASAPPAPLAAFTVRRPGVVLFDPAARRRELGAMTEAQRRALCGEPPERWPSHPVIKGVEARDDGGPDDRAEPFALTVMREAAAAHGLGDDRARSALVRLLDRWARGGGLTRFDKREANAYYAIDRAFLPTVVAWSLVRDAPELDGDRAERIRRWLRRVARLRGDLRPDEAGGEVTRRNNHHYLSASADMAWGALVGDDAYFRAGVAAFDLALADMRPDGSLPLETERGARALWYQRHAVASLVTIAELAAAQGHDLYGRQDDGRDLHAAVRFLLDAIDDPALVRAYARTDHKPGVDQDSEEQDLTFLARRGHGRHYMAWVEPYAARFPEREESRRLLALLAEADPGFRPMVDDYSGGNASCFFARRTSADPVTP